MERLLRIGAFAKLGHVTIKALRFYDEEGLLRPAQIDQRTGYRYYTLRQLGLLALITNLRAAGFAIADILQLAKCGDDPAALAVAIDAQRRRLAAERGALDARIRLIEALSRTASDAAGDDPAAIRLTSIAPQRVFSISRRVAGLGSEVTLMFEAAESEVAKLDARAADAPFLIFHQIDPSKEGFRLEACIPVSPAVAADAATSTTIAYPHACSLVYAGGYEKTFPLYGEMTAWIARAGLRAAGPLREVYHRFGADEADYKLPPAILAQSSAGYLTELQIPLALT